MYALYRRGLVRNLRVSKLHLCLPDGAAGPLEAAPNSALVDGCEISEIDDTKQSTSPLIYINAAKKRSADTYKSNPDCHETRMPVEGTQMTVTERACISPIWYTPGNS
jgi:hypothetical protein